MKYIRKAFVGSAMVMALALAQAFGPAALAQNSGTNSASSSGSTNQSLPESQIESTIGASGMDDNGVLHITVQRTDIGNVQGPQGTTNVTFTPSFQIHGDITFQPLTNGQAFLNADMALKETEVNPFISALITNNLIFQAFHQHAPTSPQVWFVHFRGAGDPLALAQATRAAINVTSTPLPQPSPMNTNTPLDAQRLASILHGTATVEDNGVVTVSVLRTNQETIAGIPVNPAALINTLIEFNPLGGTNAVVVPDFGMTAQEVQPVVTRMLVNLGWSQGCLYNQETDEQPQLYFDHMLKTGDAYQLAQEIRQGLDLMQVQ